MQKIYIWNPITRSCETGEYLGSAVVDLAIICDEIIDTKKTVPTKSVPK